jgi:hypothetical protein
MRRVVVVVSCVLIANLACPLPGVGTPTLTNASDVGTATLTNLAGTPTTRPECARVTAERAVHLRSQANADSPSLAHLLNGDVVRVLDQADSKWWLVATDSMRGYVRADYLTIVACPRGGSNGRDLYGVR